MNRTMLEAVAEKVHDRWMASKLAKGITTRKTENGEELMVPYSQLSEEAKDLDRGSVQATCEGIAAAGYVVIPVNLPRAISHIAAQLQEVARLSSEAQGF